MPEQGFPGVCGACNDPRPLSAAAVQQARGLGLRASGTALLLLMVDVVAVDAVVISGSGRDDGDGVVMVLLLVLWIMDDIMLVFTDGGGGGSGDGFCCCRCTYGEKRLIEHVIPKYIRERKKNHHCARRHVSHKTTVHPYSAV